jgi:outer membrane lipoprotein-sorting protein
MKYALLAALLPALALQGDDAEKAFRDFEKKVADAKALHVAGDITARENDKEAKLHFALTLAEGNKARVKVNGNVEGRELTFEVISDGKSMRMTRSQAGRGQAGGGQSPDHFTEMLGTVLSRVGVIGSMKAHPQLGKSGKADLEKAFGISNFKAGKAEKVNGRPATVVHYDVKVQGKDESRVTLWLDAGTGLPLKREIVADNGKARITETYKEFNVNPKVDDKTFELSR